MAVQQRLKELDGEVARVRAELAEMARNLNERRPPLGAAAAHSEFLKAYA